MVGELGEKLETRIRVMLVEDQPNFRSLMVELLNREPDLEVVAQAGSLAEARSQAAVRHDVAVLDLGLPDGNGAELIGDLREANSRVRVLVLSAILNHENLSRATRAGADEVIDKLLSPLDEVVDTVRRLGAVKPPEHQ